MKTFGIYTQNQTDNVLSYGHQISRHFRIFPISPLFGTERNAQKMAQRVTKKIVSNIIFMLATPRIQRFTKMQGQLVQFKMEKYFAMVSSTFMVGRLKFPLSTIDLQFILVTPNKFDCGNQISMENLHWYELFRAKCIDEQSILDGGELVDVKK